MGLMDILNGMQHGPKGQRPPAGSSSSGGGGMSPIMMALLGLLAYKALKGRGSPAAAPGHPVPPQPGTLPPGGTATAGNPAGGLGDILGGLFGGKAAAPAGGKPGGSLADMLPGGLGGLLGGAAAGSVVSGGLGNLIKEMQESGQGKTVQSWVGKGPNDEIAPRDLASALGGDTLDTLSRQTGMGRDDLLEGLRHYLPQLVDQLTPDGRVPTADEAGRMI